MTEGLAAARVVLADEPAWLVGGAVRDQLLGRATTDVDVALAGDPRAAAVAIARAAGGTAFELSGAFGAWRVVGRGGGWNVDLVRLRDGDLAADLAARDFTINAMAEPIAGGELLDPHGGRADLEARRLRMVSAAALADDPLRTLRAARLAVELELELDPATREEVRRRAPELAGVAPERVFAELKRIVCSERAPAGLLLAEDLGVAPVVLPELAALRGVEQNVFHHRDVHGHTLEVLEAVAELQAGAEALGEHAGAVRALLAEPLGDDLTRGGAMRFAALLHDAAKPVTRRTRPDGRVTFIGHDAEGAELARGVLRRLRASHRVAEYVATLTLHHLRLGFLVHERPLSRRAIWRYLAATDPYAADVTVFTVADRLATRGRNADAAIAAHLELAREMLGPALARRAERRPAPLVRGDELAAALDLAPGPRLGALLDALEEARYAGEISTREEAVSLARSLLS
jgi:putative nucleotidyltransferase with HDIG domain